MDFNKTFSRRDSLKLGLATGLGYLGLHSYALAESADSLITKAIPRTGEKIPVIGLGTNKYGVDAPEEIERRAEVLKEMAKQGLTLIDTAPGYGKSEIVLGNIIEKLGNRDQYFIASKVTSQNEDGKDGIAMLEETFKRFKTDKIDLIQIHSLRGTKQLLPILREWKAAGKIRYIGITTSSTNQHEELAKNIENETLDFVQVDYSVANREAEKTVLAKALEHKTAVLVNLPLGGGGNNLAAKTKDKPLPEWAKEIQATSWAQIFLKYVVSHPAVTTAIPGTTQAKHLIDNAGAAKGTLPDADFRKKIEEAYAKL